MSPCPCPLLCYSPACPGRGDPAAWKLVSSGVKLYNCVQCPAHAVCFSASYRWPPCSLFQCVHTDLSRLITFENMIFMLLRMIICVQNLWKDYTLTLDLYVSDFGGKINSFLTWTNLSICTLVRPPQSQTKPLPPHPTVQFCWAASCARQKNRVTSKNPKI